MKQCLLFYILTSLRSCQFSRFWPFLIGLPQRRHFHALEKEMATHSSVLAWGIRGTGEPGGLPSIGSHSQTRLKPLSSSDRASQVALVVKNPPANVGDMREDDLIPGSGRSPGGGNGNLLLYSHLENSMDKWAWWATVHGVSKSQIQLSTHEGCCVSFHIKYFIVALICVSLCHMLGVSFHTLICHVYILFSEVALKTFGPFFSQVVFLLLNSKEPWLRGHRRA